MNSSPLNRSLSESPEWLKWRVAAAFKMLLWRGSVALEKMIYRPLNETPVVSKAVASAGYPEATWVWDTDQAYLLADGGPDGINVLRVHPISDN